MYQIDQSGKIEQTNKNTVLGYSNSITRSILIPKKLKRKIQEVFRLHGFTSLFVYFLFSVGIFYLIEEFENKQEITIDTEYPGKDKIISSILESLLRNFNKPHHNISFARIGNRPPAHYVAKDVYDKKKIASTILNMEDVINALKKTDGRLRECISTLVGVQAQSLNKIYHKKGKKSSLKKRISYK